MKVVATHIVNRDVYNGPDKYSKLVELKETEDGSFFETVPEGIRQCNTDYALKLIGRDIAKIKAESTWQDMETAPWNKAVLLRGNSGYLRPHDTFLINGYRVRDWHQGEWNDATGTQISERGWVPLQWKENEE